MKHVSEYLHEAFEERAAIREYCGGQPRNEAEEAARIEVEQWMKLKHAIDQDEKR